MEKFNIFDHILVPEHMILTDQEKDSLLSGLNVSEFQLPSISSKDPAAKALNARPGNIIKIERDGKLGKDIAYRRVI